MSDVLIKRMEMPKSCEDCMLESYCGLWVLLKDRPSRHPDCPLVPVPPHGRLIDADDLIRRCNQHINECENSIAPQAQYYRDRDRDFIRSLEIAPTIIPAEEET